MSGKSTMDNGIDGWRAQKKVIASSYSLGTRDTFDILWEKLLFFQVRLCNWRGRVKKFARTFEIL